MASWLTTKVTYFAENAKRYLSDRLWIRPALAVLGSLAVAFGGLAFDQVANNALPFNLNQDALSNLLSIFASSMLAVATFSVSAIVTAISAVSNGTTPRASRLVLEDATAQNVLASFIGAFVYSLVALLALEAFNYGNVGRLFLFLGLVGIVAWVLLSFLQWVDHVTTLGRIGPTIEKLTNAALECVNEDSVACFGAHAYTGMPPRNSAPIMSDKIGYLANFDIAGLNALAHEHEAVLFLECRPGKLIDTTSPIAHVVPASSPLMEETDKLLACFSVDPERSYQKDVRFGLLNLAETADRALSPGINDPGTAIVIMMKQLVVLTRWADVRREVKGRKAKYDRLHIPPIEAIDLIDDCFTAIARDGAGVVEVGIALQKTLQAVVRLGDRELAEAALEQSRIALEIAEHAMVAENHKKRIRVEAAEVEALAGD